MGVLLSCASRLFAPATLRTNGVGLVRQRMGLTSPRQSMELVDRRVALQLHPQPCATCSVPSSSLGQSLQITHLPTAVSKDQVESAKSG
jgi:hypothetical protein